MSNQNYSAEIAAQLPNIKWVNDFQKRLAKWYTNHGRKLAWRGTLDPYQIWISEIMLQQTTTAAVDGYYRRFLERFSNVQTLAAAEDSEVLRYWEGLGYYRRATQLHRAAQIIVSEHNSIFPNNFAAVLALPGIGRYTAGAILSIAQNQRLPILEANTIRLHARLLAYADDPAQSDGNKLLWAMAEHVLPTFPMLSVISGQTAPFTDVSPLNHAGVFNQALMDLGSLVCFPKSPNCKDCPIVSLCKTAQLGLQHVIPAIKRKLEFEQRVEVAVVIEKNDQYLLMRYPDGVRWAGLWDFPRHVILSDVMPIEKNQQFLSDMKRLTGCNVQISKKITTIRHTVTRFKITLDVYYARLIGKSCSADYETQWVSKSELTDIPLNTTGRKITTHL